jgi:hypothetical protein
MRFEVFTMAEMSVLFFWVIMPCALTGLKDEDVSSSKMLVSTYMSTQCNTQMTNMSKQQYLKL